MNNIENDTKMYIEAYKAVKRNDTDINGNIIISIIATIEENLTEYEIEKYNGYGTPTEQIEYYILKLSQKAFNIENIFETSYFFPYRDLPYSDIGKHFIIEKTIRSIKTEEEVHKFLEWFKTVNCGIVDHFDYEIITDDQISNIACQNKDSIEIKRRNYYYDFYNPIICWNNGETLMIMDWTSLRNNIIYEYWIDVYNDFESFEKEFCTPTLYQQLKEDYGSLNENIITELKKEIIKLYNEYKDDIIVDKYGDAECPSEGMMLIDVIWNHAPLFRESIIAHYIVKLHKKELRI